MANRFREHVPGPETSAPDISQLVTARLRPLGSHVKTAAQQLAQHRSEIRRLSELADMVEQAVTALIIRLHMSSDPVKRGALEHSRADLQRFKDELDSVLREHQRELERLQVQ
jgi:hypothetical protein